MTTALYRRYRPDTFADVIGQEHVTVPLMKALRDDRVNHAYLFSGPRGCGKTTSARILARCLNCEQGPTDHPCGTCPSCIELATGGPGSLDVVEIDAASHNGVDDARDLRERAFFAPTRDRFKVYILDEAHMVTNQGFNALLKLVEEPPPHIKFVFATTEPDKVIATIRSRTHHYPFRLVAPGVLTDYLGMVAQHENVELEQGVLPLVVRAGGGSVRDSLSVLDQLIAGSGGPSVKYENAVALLGYTPEALLDETVDSIAARDGAALFGVIERVIATGHEPRRFVEDLLERLRDLIVTTAAPDDFAGLGGRSADQLARMRAQSGHLGLPALTMLADLVNTALTDMVGTTAPRLQLELLMARLLVAQSPAVGSGAGGAAGAAVSAPAGPTTTPPPAKASAEPVSASAEPAPAKQTPAKAEQPDAPPAQPTAPHPRAQVRSAPVRRDRSAPVRSAPARRDRSAPVRSDRVIDNPTPAPAPTDMDTKPATGQLPTAADAALVRRRWQEVLDTLFNLNKAAWSLVSQSATVLAVTGDSIELAFTLAPLAEQVRRDDRRKFVEQAIRETLGLALTVVPVVSEAGAAVSAPVADSSPEPEPEDDLADSSRLLTGLELIQAQLGGEVVSDEETAP